MKFRCALTVLAYALCTLVVPARAAQLDGPLIQSVNADRATYRPGEVAQVWVTLSNHGAAAWSGTLSGSLTHLGRQMGPVAPATVAALAPGEHRTVGLHVSLPNQDGRGYHLAVAAVATNGSVTDTALRGLDVSSDPSRFMRQCWLSDFSANVDTRAIVQNLNLWGCNAVQFHDVLPAHHWPDAKLNEPTWTNLSGKTVVALTMSGYQAQAHQYRMQTYAYNLWNGAYPNFDSDNSGVQLRWGLFTRPCSTTQPCTAGDMDATPGNPRRTPPPPANELFPQDWAARALLLMDGGNAEWRQHIAAGMGRFLSRFGFDGWQIDTLGPPNKGVEAGSAKQTGDTAPAQRWNASGRVRDMAPDLVPFLDAARTVTGRRAVLNNVSRWSEATVAGSGRGEAIYTELWPWDAPFYPSVNGITAAIRQHTMRAIEVPAYGQTAYAAARYGCNPSSDPRCFVNAPGARMMTAAVLLAGAHHVSVGDFDKWATNVFWPGPMLGLAPAAMQALLDYHQFGISYQELLRLGSDSPDTPAIITAGATGSPEGAAGAVWTVPKRALGRQIVQLLNLTGLSNNKFHDLTADQPQPTLLHDVGIKMYYVGNLRPGGSPLVCATPDGDHGAPRQLPYKAGADASGTFVTFSLPTLSYWSVCWIETAAVHPSGDGLVFGQVFTGADLSAGADGLGTARPLALAGACCGRWARFDDVLLPSRASSAKLGIIAEEGGTLEMRLASPEGPKLGLLTLPPKPGLRQATMPLTPDAWRGTENRDLIVVFRDHTMQLVHLSIE